MIGARDPAFPTALEGGMDLRTYLAAHAPVEEVFGYNLEVIKNRAAAAVAFADAVIEELNK